MWQIFGTRGDMTKDLSKHASFFLLCNYLLLAKVELIPCNHEATMILWCDYLSLLLLLFILRREFEPKTSEGLSRKLRRITFCIAKICKILLNTTLFVFSLNHRTSHKQTPPKREIIDGHIIAGAS